MSNSKGVTLIELIVVVAIIGLLALLISGNTATPMNKLTIESAANMIAQDIRLTQQMALAKGDVCFFEINTRDNYYQIRSQQSGTYKKESIDRSISISVNGFQDPYSGSSGDFKVLRYNPTGTPSTTGTITLRKGDLVKQITVMVGTGRVKIN